MSNTGSGSESTGTLFVVATPIGNLADLSSRAADILAAVSMVAAEDTRHTGRLLTYLGLRKRLVSLHEHNEADRVAAIAELLTAGEDVALVSDAGTPLISDPGFRLVRAVGDLGLRVSPVPGACSLIAALSAAGLPTDRFVFEGFLPAREAARRQRLQALARETRTVVLLESSHRVVGSVRDMVAVLGPDREAVVARELTKAYETIRRDVLTGLLDWLQADTDQQRGEFVIMLAGAAATRQDDTVQLEGDRLLGILLETLPTREAARLAARITGLGKNRLYRRALELAGQ